MKNTIKKLSILAFVSGSLTSVTNAQLGWTTSGGDAQRTRWVRTDGYISVESLQQQRFGVEWKRKLENTPRQLNSVMPGVSNGDTGWNVTPANIAGSSNNVYGLELDTGGVVWARHFDVPMPAGTPTCPGGITTSVSRPTVLDQIVTGSAGPFRGRGGRGPLAPVSGVGLPGEGVPADLMRNPRLAAGRVGLGEGGRGAPLVPREAGGTDATSPVTPRFIPPSVNVPNLYVVTNDGMMHTLGQFLGKDVQKPAPFLPANANVTDLIAVNGKLYATTVNGCAGAPNGIWAIDLASEGKSVSWWKNAANPVGSPAIDSKGTLYVAIGEGPPTSGGYSNAIVALDPNTLQPRDWFTAVDAAFVTSPTIFIYKGHEIVAAASKEGRVFLLDTASLGGVDHKTPLSVSAPARAIPVSSPSALGTWEDLNQNRWLLAPVGGAKGNITALKVTGDAAKPVLQQGWMSRELVSPAAPIVVNGVAFVLSTGEYNPATDTTVADKVSKSLPAVLYALDASTGKELWNSGRAITSFVHSGGLWASNGQVYVGTYDSTVYAFGFAMDRHL